MTVLLYLCYSRFLVLTLFVFTGLTRDGEPSIVIIDKSCIKNSVYFIVGGLCALAPLCLVT